MTTRATILDAARDAVTRDRAATHGPAERTFGTIAELWSVYLDTLVTDADAANLMILMKVARARGNPGHADNWIDIAGYAACGGELACPRTAAEALEAPSPNVRPK